VCFQLFATGGARIGADTCINGGQSPGSPRAIARADGGFTIVWLEPDDPLDLSQEHWQDYDAAGNAQGTIQSGPPPFAFSARRLAGGGFVKLLQTEPPNRTASFQLYAPDGTPVGAQKPVAEGTTQASDIVGLAGGSFAVAWLQLDGGATVAMTRVFSADGTPLGDPVALGPNTLGAVNCGRFGTVAICPPFQTPSGITASPDGGYIVAWADAQGLGSVGDTFARQFRADGSPASAVIGRIGRVRGPIATMSADEFVMATTDNGTDVAALHILAQPLR
jgi:hypothetical protein